MTTRTTINIASKTINIAAEDVTEKQIQAVAAEANRLIGEETVYTGNYDEMTAVCMAFFKLVGEHQDLKDKYDKLNKSIEQLTRKPAAPKRSYTPAKKQEVPSDSVSGKK